MVDQAPSTGLLTGGNTQELGIHQPRRFTTSGGIGDGSQRIRRDDQETKSATRNASGAFEATVSALDKIMARFDQLEFRLDATDRRVDGVEATRIPDPDPPYFSYDADADSQHVGWKADEDLPWTFNHDRGERGGDFRCRRGAVRESLNRGGHFPQFGTAAVPYRSRPENRPRSSWDRPVERYQQEFDRGQDRAWSYPPDRPRIPRSYFSRNSYVHRRCSTTEHYSWVDQQPSTDWPPRRYPPRHVYSAALPVPSSMRKDEPFLSRSISYGKDESEDL